jgi:hypothetical protein
MRKINDRVWLLWIKIFQTFILFAVVVLAAIVFVGPTVWYFVKYHSHDHDTQSTTSVTCAYDVTAKEKAAYVAGKTAAYQHMLATQCKKLNDTHPTQSQDCSKIDSDAVITDKQYGQSDEPQD